MPAKIGLALGSGGLRGMAHLGVLRVLERERIPVNCIAGCSIGSLIGALYACGLEADVIWKLAKKLKRRHWLDFIIPKMGIVAGDRALEMLTLLTQKKRFDQLGIPLSVIATELNEGREVVFDSGEVAPAVRASISVPGIFVPFNWNGKLYVDGAVLNPTPVDAARKMGADIVIGVDLANAGTISNITNVFDVIIQSIDIMERELCKKRLQHCEILVRPDVGGISPSSFDDIDACVLKGEEAAVAALPQIRTMLDNANKCIQTGSVT